MGKSTFFSRFQDWLSEWSEAKTRQVLIVVLAVLLGVLLGMIVYTISKYLIAPSFPGLYFDAPQERQELMKTVGMQVFVLVPAMWGIGTLIGGYCAVRVAKMGQFPAWIVGILLTAYFWSDLPSLPNTPDAVHPVSDHGRPGVYGPAGWACSLPCARTCAREA